MSDEDAYKILADPKSSEADKDAAADAIIDNVFEDRDEYV